MTGRWIAFALALSAWGQGATSSTAVREQPPHRIRVVLVGDSTVTSDKGWGAGFCALLDSRVECLDAASSGRSSKSYIDEGKWKDALALKGDYYLVQFGHNDEPGKGPNRETDPATTYLEYMSRYVDEARAAGAQPVLITSLTRRRFDETGHVVPNLGPYVEAVKTLAAAKHVPLIDLHARSVEAGERMGDAVWAALSPHDEKGELDRTHLNAKGGAVIARLVARDLRATVPALTRHLVAGEGTADAVVAQDGSGDFAHVQDAVNAAPQDTAAGKRWVIFVKPGRYRELVYVQREKRFVMLVGENPATTSITYDLHANLAGPDGKPLGTFRTPTVLIDADDFSVENLTIENGAGPVGQALALRVDGDRVVFRNCRFLGWQDTIFLDRGRQYFSDVFIAGHVDFIFGGATAWFERARLHAWANGYVTAASTPPSAKYGFVFADGSITGESSGVRTYLGRPWRANAQVTFLKTEMSDVVRPEGWHNWDRPDRERTSRYSEWGSSGAGANPKGRVRWATPMGAAEASALSAVRVLAGADGWDPRQVPAHESDIKVRDLPVPPPPGTPAQRGRVIQLWPEGVPGAKPDGGEERVLDERVYNVQKPSLTMFPAPSALAAGAAVIVCPGGAYARLAIEKEGTAIARILNGMGVTAFVLRYRMVEYGHPAPLQDVLRAVRLVRSRAAEFGVRPDRIGVWGASAGGHVAASAATLFDAPEGRTGAPLDSTSGRPDFAVLLYPVITMQPPMASETSRANLLGEHPSPELLARLSLETQVTKDTPPVFLVHTGEDTSVPLENSVMFYEALRRAGVRAELHLYERGAHGFATAADLGPTSGWPQRMEEWLRAHGWLERPGR